MRKLVLGVALAAMLAFAASGPPQASAERIAQASAIVFDVVSQDEAFTSRAVYHGPLVGADELKLAAEKKSSGEKSSGKRGSSGSGSQVSLVIPHTLRL